MSFLFYCLSLQVQIDSGNSCIKAGISKRLFRQATLPVLVSKSLVVDSTSRSFDVFGLYAYTAIGKCLCMKCVAKSS